jgi:hypothetical protein
MLHQITRYQFFGERSFDKWVTVFKPSATGQNQTSVGKGNMLNLRKTKTFFLILVNHDIRIFNVVGPISDDADWTNKIREIQRAGKNINSFTYSSTKSFDAIVNSYSKQTNYTFSRFLIIDHPEYRGTLPKYAENADRKKLVKILCKGQCATIRWAEMKVNYPGEEALENSQFGDFAAICLLCGQEAGDPYNWGR